MWCRMTDFKYRSRRHSSCKIRLSDTASRRPRKQYKELAVSLVAQYGGGREVENAEAFVGRPVDELANGLGVGEWVPDYAALAGFLSPCLELRLQ